MVRHLIDNNTISHFCSAKLPDKARVFISTIIDSQPAISVITKIEALSWKASDPAFETIASRFIASSAVFDLTPAVVDKTIELRRAMRIKIPDAIIAATAIVHNLTLITSDSDFNAIPGLKTINPLAMS